MDGFDRRWYADPKLHGEDYFLLFPPAILEKTAWQVDGLVRLLDLPADGAPAPSASTDTPGPGDAREPI